MSIILSIINLVSQGIFSLLFSLVLRSNSVLTSTLVLGIRYFVITTRPLHPIQGYGRGVVAVVI